MKKCFNQILTIISVTLFIIIFGACNRKIPIDINLAHLDRLCEDIVFADRPCTIVHIYSDYPEYEWVDAQGEGIACVDDVARAAVLYIAICDSHQDTLYASRIRRLLNFVLAMQTDDGEFYNFIDANRQINKDGTTSCKSFNFWAARAYWAIGTGYRFFKKIDPGYARMLKKALIKCEQPIQEMLNNYYGKYESQNGRHYPLWLINHYAGDATSELLLGLVEFLGVEDHSSLRLSAEKLAQGLLAMQINQPGKMYGAFESWPGVWHPWGNSQVVALVKLGRLLQDENYIAAAELAARAAWSRLVIGGMEHEYDVKQARFTRYPQIAYDIRPMALGFLALFNHSGNNDYAILAGITGSWLLGNNAISIPMYDTNTGRGYDGLDLNGRNNNSGAESTIEALYTLAQIRQQPVAAAWLRCQSRPMPEIDGQLPETIQRLFCSKTSNVIILWDAKVNDFNIRPTSLNCRERRR